jgi:arylsulfatase A-like enzyme
VLFWRYGGKLAVRQGDWKLLRERAGADFQLFHLARDVAEANDLSAACPERAEALRALLESWNARMAEPRRP